MSERTFEVLDAESVTAAMPLSVGLVGPSGSGKTWSMMRLATGMMKALGGGKFYVIDTESDRALHYKKYFSFKHLSFKPPHSPADFERAIDRCIELGAKVIGIDSASEEHTGDGGLLDMIDAFLEKKAGDDYDKRNRMLYAAQIIPKAQRKKLNRKISNSKTFFILCYRASDKIKPPKKGDKEPQHLGWQAETTSPLPYMMTVRFLLPPGSDGKPNLTPATVAEQLEVKNPEQFRGWFSSGFQLDEALGEKLALWALGDSINNPRKPLLDQITAYLATRHPGKTEVDKQAKLATLIDLGLPASWREVSNLPIEALEAAVGKMTEGV